MEPLGRVASSPGRTCEICPGDFFNCISPKLGRAAEPKSQSAKAPSRKFLAVFPYGGLAGWKFFSFLFEEPVFGLWLNIEDSCFCNRFWDVECFWIPLIVGQTPCFLSPPQKAVSACSLDLWSRYGGYIRAYCFTDICPFPDSTRTGWS